MKLIVGLGNPGRKYEQTRHNVGFAAVAKLAVNLAADPPRQRFDGEITETAIRRDADDARESAERLQTGAGQALGFSRLEANEKLGLLCPMTYMNASGQSVRKAIDFYKLSLNDLLVICDDLNLPTGRLRIRPSGSAGGQKGLADIIRHLGSESFPRLRIGIDRPPPGWEVTDYVLGKFSGSEKETIELATARAADAALDWAKHNTAYVANLYNPDPKLSKTSKPKK